MDSESSFPISRPTPFGELPYEGFLTPGELWETDFAAVPKRRGLYQVLWCDAEKPLIMDQNPAGRFKGKDPSASREELRAHWIDATTVLYIGVAGAGKSRTNLRSRVRSMIRFARGEPVGHWSGRYLWQLADSAQLLIAWSPMRSDPIGIERELLARFTSEYGALPFAN